MEEWLILKHPGILLLTLCAILINLFDRKYKQTKGLFTYLSALIMFSSMAWLYIVGANAREIISLLIIFLLINIGEKS